MHKSECFVLPVVNEYGVVIDEAYMNKNHEIKYEKTVYQNLYEPFTSLIDYSFYYSFNVKNNHSHAHDFDGVIRELYYNPESFNIPDNEKYLYSSQELTYLRKLQNLLLVIGLKDMERIDEKELIRRAHNKKLMRIIEYRPLKLEKTANFVIDGIRKNIITKFYSDLDIEYNGKYLILDNNDNYLGLVETKKEKISINDVDDMVDYKLQGYSSIDEYKNDLINDFNITSSSPYVVLETFIKIEKF